MFYRIIDLKKLSWMIKIFLKSPSVGIHYDEEESPSVEMVGVQYEEEEEEEYDEKVVFIRKTPAHPRDRLRRKTTKRFKYF